MATTTLSDLPRVARAQRVPAARHPVGRGRCGTCHAQGRSLPSGVGTRAVARWGISARASAEPRGFLPAANYPRLWLRARGAGDVSEVSSDLRLARTDGKLADNEALSSRPAAARPDRTCAAMGGIAPPEILKREPLACLVFRAADRSSGPL